MDRYAVFGHPVHHSVSPALHHAFATQTGQALEYTKQAVQPDQFAAAVNRFFHADGKGLNITLPFKRQAYALADRLTKRARCAQAVNTLWKDAGGKLHGDNTDGVGFIRDLTVNQRIAVADKTILLIGAGGAARGVLNPLATAGPKRLHIANRTSGKAVELAASYPAEVTGGGLNAWPHMQFDLIINASAAGHNKVVSTPPATRLAPELTCYDLSYGTPAAPFLSWAHAQGATKAIDGWGMLVEQAAEAFELWRDIRPDTAPVIAARERLTRP